MDGPEEIAEAVGRLRAGGVVAFPTETVYGLGADALSEAAVGRVFSLKGRPAENPLIVHVAGETMARRVVAGWPERAERVTRALWPGPVTIVLPKGAGVPASVTAGGGTVAVRCPDHPLALALIEAFGGPLVGPSANPSGYVSPTTAAHVRAHFGAGEVLTLDGGACRAGLESTVVDLSRTPAVVLRRGVVGPERLAEVLGEGVVEREAGPGAGLETGDGPVASPGLLGPHYRPRARVVVVETLAEAHAALGGLEPVDAGVVLSPPGAPVAVDAPNRSIAMPESASAYAADLYAALREADEAGARLIVVALPGSVGRLGDAGERAVWAAVRERLSRASA